MRQGSGPVTWPSRSILTQRPTRRDAWLLNRIYPVVEFPWEYEETWLRYLHRDLDSMDLPALLREGRRAQYRLDLEGRNQWLEERLEAIDEAIAEERAAIAQRDTRPVPPPAPQLPPGVTPPQPPAQPPARAGHFEVIGGKVVPS